MKENSLARVPLRYYDYSATILPGPARQFNLAAMEHPMSDSVIFNPCMCTDVCYYIPQIDIDHVSVHIKPLPPYDNIKDLAAMKKGTLGFNQVFKITRLVYI